MATSRRSRDNPLSEALRLGKMPFLFAALFSVVSNLLFLSLPIYTHQVFSRVLTSYSQSTLVVLTLGVLFVFTVSSVIDILRSRVLIGFGLLFDRQLSSDVFAALFNKALLKGSTARSEALRDFDQLRQAITGSSIGVMFDVPFIPVFVGVLFIVDPAVGFLTLIGGLVLLGLAILQDRSTRKALEDSNNEALKSYNFTEAALRNGEVVRALGMMSQMAVHWRKFRAPAIERWGAAGDRTVTFANLIKMIRLYIQIAVIALSAYLVIRQSLPAGMLFANMLIAARAMAPIERLVGSWNTLVNAHQSYERLETLFEDHLPPSAATALPRPTGAIGVSRLTFGLQNSPRPLLTAVSFDLPAGETLGVVGPSGAGKSTLMRLLVGVYRPVAGSVRLDGADVYDWERSSFGAYVGYLPQDIELFGGTIRDNIARFLTDVDDADVVAAAEQAGAHELILRMPNGYDTEVGDGGAVLSGGQRQRIGLARALFGDPALVVLDEPNANLDTEGEAALMDALQRLKARRATVVIASHRANIFRTADKMLVLKDGRVDSFGPRAEILAPLLRPAGAPAEESARAGR